MGLIFLKMLKLGMTKVWLGSFVPKAKIKYDWSFSLLEILKQLTAGVLFYLIC